MDSYGVAPERLSNDDLERHRAEAYATREWALRRGTEEQFQRHTVRMLELEQEYLRRQLRRQAHEWRVVTEQATRLGDALRGLVTQLEAHLDAHHAQVTPALPAPPPAAMSAAVEAIIATGSWAPDTRTDRSWAPDTHPGRLEAAPEHWTAEERRAPAHRATHASNWRGRWGGSHHQASA
jgi:hypothetical protein